MSKGYEHYYVPEKSIWPFIGSIGLFFIAIGAVNLIHNNTPVIVGLGALIIITMLFGWFGNVVKESMSGLYSAQMDRSFRMGMFWFIFSEVMFFAAFFGALFYARNLAVPWLGGAGSNEMTHALLWPTFNPAWPVLVNPDAELFKGPKQVFDAMGLPALNTAILLTSGLTLTWAHHGLIQNNRKKLNIGLFLTVALGFTFMYFQAVEYHHAYNEYGLTLNSGIYGSTFFMLTGFHGMHVLLGATILAIILIRCLKGHFSKEHHFAFEAAAWYWHFVDVVWLFLYVFVYWI